MRKLCWFALPFSAAVFAACYVLPMEWLLLAAGLTAAAGAGCVFVKGNTRRRWILACVGGALGLLWFFGWSRMCVRPAMELAGHTASAEALVIDYPEAVGLGVRIRAEVELDIPVKTLIYADERYGSLKPGDRVTMTARFKGADHLYGENVTYYTSKGIFLIAYAQGELEIESAEKTPLRLLPACWARALKKSIHTVFPEDGAALVSAVLLGERDGLGDAVTAALSRSGLSHTVAVSGMHMSFLASLCMMLCGKRRRLAALVTIPALFFFALTVGASPSVMRATMMHTLLLLGPLLGREPDGPTSLSFALMVLLVCNPYAAASTSLQLSFAAVAGIYLISEPLMDKLSPLYSWTAEGVLRRLLRGLAHFFCAGLTATLGALLFTTPLSAWYFGTVSVIAPLSNLLTLWAVSFLFMGGLVAALVGVLHVGVGMALAIPVTWLARYVLAAARLLSVPAFAAVSMSSFYCRVWLVGVYLIIAALFLFRKEHPRPIVPVCACVITLCAALFFTSRAAERTPLTLSVLDVGQGASAAFYLRGSTVLVDCGGNSLSNPGDIAADHFQALGCSHLDLLVLTHFDDDHFNGVEQLFARMDVGGVVIPNVEDENGHAARLLSWAQAERAQVWVVDQLCGTEIGGASFTFYPPLGKGTTNEAGLMVLATAGTQDVLITGDADGAIEAMLVKYFQPPDIEVLLVGHHGSRHSTTEAFLAAVKPETAVISSGYNTYGHPADDTLRRLAEANAAVYSTDQQGTVTVPLTE